MCQRAYDISARYQDAQLIEAGHRWSISETMLGFIGDVGQLAKLVMIHQGSRASNEDIKGALQHELSDCLWSVIVLAKRLDINLEKAFLETMDELEGRLGG